MQKIIEKLKNTPGSVQLLQAPCSVSSGLNKEEISSVQNKVLSIISSNGVHCKGERILINKKSINIKLVDGVYNFGNLVWRTAIPSRLERRGLFAC